MATSRPLTRQTGIKSIQHWWEKGVKTLNFPFCANSEDFWARCVLFRGPAQPGNLIFELERPERLLFYLFVLESLELQEN